MTQPEQVQYIAKRRIPAPGQYVNAYQPGDPVAEQVVRDWGLDDDDVERAEDYQPPRPAETSTDRAAWESYVVGQGTSQEDARAASLRELRDMYERPTEEVPAWQVNDGIVVGGATPVTAENHPAPAEVRAAEPAAVPERPTKSAPKGEWVEWVVTAGASQEWARSGDTTKDDLMAWEPGRNA